MGSRPGRPNIRQSETGLRLFPGRVNTRPHLVPPIVGARHSHERVQRTNFAMPSRPTPSVAPEGMELPLSGMPEELKGEAGPQADHQRLESDVSPTIGGTLYLLCFQRFIENSHGSKGGISHGIYPLIYPFDANDELMRDVSDAHLEARSHRLWKSEAVALGNPKIGFPHPTGPVDVTHFLHIILHTSTL